MGRYLYRGVSVARDEENKGEILPKGRLSSTTPEFGQEGLMFGDDYVFGPSEGNAVRGHQICSGMGGGCYVSTTTSKKVAESFATYSDTEEGFIYLLDRSLFEKYEIEAHELPNSVNSHELEVTIRASDNGAIPKEVIVRKEKVSPSWM